VSAFRCPSCRAELHVSQVVDVSPSKAAPPAPQPTPGVHVAADPGPPAQALVAETEVHERWLRSAPPGVRGEFEEKLGYKLADWLEKWQKAKGRKPGDEPSKFEREANHKNIRALFLAEFAARKRIGPRVPTSNPAPLSVPVGDRDDDPSEE
jgi:hypothetical protein